MTENPDSNYSSKMQVCVKIAGRVQGVWYRGWTVEEANVRGVDGWVANRSDGSVYALFIGEELVVQDMILACSKGPDLAHVTSITEIIYDENSMPERHLGVFYNAGNY